MSTWSETEVEKLQEQECWRLLATVELGRIAVIVGDGVDIFPVNYLVQDSAIYFSSAPGSKLRDFIEHPRVAFEADGILDRKRWSVVAKGAAQRMVYDDEIETSGVQQVHSLIPTDKWNYIRIAPTAITGRRFRSGRRHSV